MKEIILADKLVEVIRDKRKKADDLICSEEYRAGYVEALDEVFLYMPWMYCNKENYPRNINRKE